jgi:hypothetical protein
MQFFMDALRNNQSSEGFAFGGMAGMGAGGMNGGFPGAPQSPKWGRMRGSLGGNRAATPGGPTRDAAGNITSYDPRNPWGAHTGNTNPQWYGDVNRMLGQAGQAGYFDPRGNQALINAQLEAAQGTKDALVRRQMTQANLSGLDPAQAAIAKQQALRDTGRGVQEIGAKVRGDALAAQDAFMKQLFANAYQNEFTDYRDSSALRNAKALKGAKGR